MPSRDITVSFKKRITLPSSCEVGLYSIRLYAWGPNGDEHLWDGGPFDILYDTTPPASNLSAVYNQSYTRTELAWDHIPHWDYYYVLRQVNGGSWSPISPPISDRIYIDNNPPSGSLNYRVLSFGKCYYYFDCSSSSISASVNVVVAATLTSVTISGATEVNEGGTAQYTCTAIYSDSSSTDVTSSATWSKNSSYATISSRGLLTAAQVNSDTSVTVTASYGGKSDTHAVTIKNVSATVPPAPTAVSASDGTYTDKVRVTWNSVSGTTGYRVYRATASGGTKTFLGTTSGTAYDDTSALAGTTYYYWVKASNAYGISDYSSFDIGIIPIGSLKVTIAPAEAVSKGAKWSVDGGLWHTSGYTQTGLAVGSHTVSFKDVSGWTKPGNLTVTINNNQTTNFSGTYSPQTGSLKVTLSPAGAVSAGAQWRVDGGPWHSSGYTQTGLAVGSHTVSFKEVSGWSKPGDQTVTVNNNQTTNSSGTYIRQAGSLKVTLSPAGAVSAGAQWRVDGGPWHSSGYTQTGLAVGSSHTVSFKDVFGWSKPGNQTVTVNNDQTTNASGTYSPQTGSLKVTLSPAEAVSAGAQWRVDDGTWHTNGDTQKNLSVGSHTVSFKEVSGWSKPGNQTVTVNNNQTTNASGTYIQDDSYNLHISIEGSGVVKRFPDGETYDSGTEVELTAMADLGWVFSGWSGDLVSTDNHVTKTIYSDVHITATFLEDSDNDGINDEEEDSGPNDGDGNNDGILDSQQSNVISMLTYNGLYFVTIETHQGTMIFDCQAIGNPSSDDTPSNFEFPYGFFEFILDNIAADGSTTVTLYFPEGMTIDTYYKFGPTPNDKSYHWYEFLYDDQTGAEINNNIIKLHFIDSIKGDDDLTADGIIIDIGGPGIVSEHSPENTETSDGGGGGGGGCFINTLLTP